MMQSNKKENYEKRKYKLPLIETRFEYKINELDTCPEVEEWRDWIFEISSLPKESFNMNISRNTLCAAVFHPLCSDINLYEHLVKYIMLLFVWDDHEETTYGSVDRNFELSSNLWTQFSQVLDKLASKEFIAMDNWTTYALGTYAVFESIYAHYKNDMSRNRFITTWRDYIDGNIEEEQILSSNISCKDVQQLLNIKHKSGGNYTLFTMIEYAEEIYLTDIEWFEPELQKLMQITSECILYCNDIFSFEKEYIHAEYKLDKLMNTVALVALNDQIQIEEAMELIYQKMLDSEMEFDNSFNRIQHDESISTNVKIFSDRLRMTIGGNFYFCLKLNRYNIFC